MHRHSMRYSYKFGSNMYPSRIKIYVFNYYIRATSVNEQILAQFYILT